MSKPLDTCDQWAIDMASKLGIPTDNLISLVIEAYTGAPIRVTATYWQPSDEVPLLAPPVEDIEINTITL